MNANNFKNEIKGGVQRTEGFNSLTPKPEQIPSKSIVLHCVYNFPELHTFFRNVEAILEYNPEYLEIQLPINPNNTMDGGIIQQANNQALEDFTLGDPSLKNHKFIIESFMSGVEHIDSTRPKGNTTKLVMISYLQPLQNFGLKNLANSAIENGLGGFIIPDLDILSGEGYTFYQKCKRYGIEVFPVVSPSTSSEDILKIQSLNPSVIYVRSTDSATGSVVDFGSDEFQCYFSYT